jgi:hypothetical protein
MHSPVEDIVTPTRKFAHIHLDLAGPLPSSRGAHTHLLTVVDRTTRWPEAFPLKSTTTEASVDALVDGWISRFGMQMW